ncbi:hypothetical protein [Paeniglutamicibacter kerguelensis]|uniref:Uncharacterized protein n=1 Tax=Paeniglutamicibacter kerguelensis TaxID=254788 RepID=A0ABS4XA78_9MICC|nr:hypothetical protein [Paeniglutamicibacter kerguelensis]MBP2385375.1 hypothetical protein [Paeniglutamicibacter kerguelensis]
MPETALTDNSFAGVAGCAATASGAAPLATGTFGAAGFTGFGADEAPCGLPATNPGAAAAGPAGASLPAPALAAGWTGCGFIIAGEGRSTEVARPPTGRPVGEPAALAAPGFMPDPGFACTAGFAPAAGLGTSPGPVLATRMTASTGLPGLPGFEATLGPGFGIGFACTLAPCCGPGFGTVILSVAGRATSSLAPAAPEFSMGFPLLDAGCFCMLA